MGLVGLVDVQNTHFRQVGLLNRKVTSLLIEVAGAFPDISCVPLKTGLFSSKSGLYPPLENILGHRDLTGVSYCLRYSSVNFGRFGLITWKKECQKKARLETRNKEHFSQSQTVSIQFQTKKMKNILTTKIF